MERGEKIEIIRNGKFWYWITPLRKFPSRKCAIETAKAYGYIPEVKKED